MFRVLERLEIRVETELCLQGAFQRVDNLEKLVARQRANCRISVRNSAAARLSNFIRRKDASVVEYQCCCTVVKLLQTRIHITNDKQS